MPCKDASHEIEDKDRGQGVLGFVETFWGTKYVRSGETSKYMNTSRFDISQILILGLLISCARCMQNTNPHMRPPGRWSLSTTDWTCDDTLILSYCTTAKVRVYLVNHPNTPFQSECHWGLFELRSLIKVSCLHLSRKDWLSGRTLTRRGFPYTYASWDPYQRGDNQSSMIGIAEEKCYHSATFLQYDPSDGCELERFWVGRVHARTRSGIPRLVF